MTTATTRIATGSLLGMVQQTANTVTSIVSTVDNSVSMLNDFVSRHRTMQAEKNVVELHLYKVRLIEDTALEISERRRQTAELLKDESFKTIYENAHSEIAALFNPELAAA